DGNGRQRAPGVPQDAQQASRRGRRVRGDGGRRDDGGRHRAPPRPRDLREGRRRRGHARVGAGEDPEAGAAAPMTPALAYWVDRMDPFLVRFTGNIGIRYYGLAYGVGFLCAAWLLHRYALAGRSLLPSSRIADFMLAAVVGVVVGGRIGSYILYDGWRSFGSDPFAILRVWEGGMA